MGAHGRFVKSLHPVHRIKRLLTDNNVLVARQPVGQLKPFVKHTLGGDRQAELLGGIEGDGGVKIRGASIASAQPSYGFEPDSAAVAVERPAHDGAVPGVVWVETEAEMLRNALQHVVVIGSEAPHSTKGEVNDSAEKPERAQQVDNHGCHEERTGMNQSVDFSSSNTFTHGFSRTASAVSRCGLQPPLR